MPVLKFFKDVAAYGLSNTYALAGNFNGHTKGLAICVIDDGSGTVETNYLPEYIGDYDKRMEMLTNLLDDTSIPKIKQHVRQKEHDGTIKMKTIVYLQYIVEGHSFMRPTISSKNIPGIQGKIVKATLEILFTIDGLNRYVTVSFNTDTQSVLDFVNVMFCNEQILNDIGCVFDDASGALTLDFYDEVGDIATVEFENAMRLRDQVASVRLVGINDVNKEGNDANVSTVKH